MGKNLKQKNLTQASQVYKFSKIVGQRIQNGKKEFKVRWQGWSPEHDTWEPAENILSGLSEHESKLIGKRGRKPSNKSLLPEQAILTESKNDKNFNLSQKQQVSEAYYQVEQVLQTRVNSEGFKQYKVRWQGYSSDYDSWEPSYNFNKQSLVLLEKKEKKLRKQTEISLKQKSLENEEQVLKSMNEHKKYNSVSNNSQLQKDINQNGLKKQKRLLKKRLNTLKRNFQKQQQISLGIQSPKKQAQDIQNDKASLQKLSKKRQSPYFCRSKDVQVLETLNLNSSCDFEARSKEKIKRRSKNYFTVQDIISRKTETNKCRTKLKYRIRWEGFSPKDDTWEVKQNLSFMKQMVEKFDESLPEPECEIVDDKIVKGKKLFKIHWKGFSEEEDTWQPIQNFIFGAKLQDAYIKKSKQMEGIGALKTMSSFKVIIKRETLYDDERQMMSIPMKNENGWDQEDEEDDEQIFGFSDEQVEEVFPSLEEPEEEFEIELENKFSTFSINLMENVSFMENQDEILKCIGN